MFHRLSPLLSDPLNPSVPDQGLAECRLCLGSGSPGLIPDDMGDGSYLGDPPLPSLAHPLGVDLSQWLQAVLPTLTLV